MPNKKINELSVRTPSLNDLMIVGDPSTGYSYKATLAALNTLIDNSTSIGDLNNVDIISPVSGQILSYNGTNWVNITPTTWNTAYDRSLVSVGVSGTTTKTLTLTKQDGSTLTASWSDLNTDAVTSVFGRTGAVVATEGDYSLDQLGDVAITTPSTNQVLQYNGTSWVNGTISVPVTSVFGRTGNVVATEGDYTLTQLGDVTLTTPSSNQVLQYNGTAWVNATLTDNGITSLNGLTAVTQTFATGTSGTDFAISSTTSTHTFNLPTASAVNRGALSSADWSTFNAKQNAITLTTTGSSGSATLVGATLNIPTYTLAGLGGVSGSGTTNYLSKWTSSSALGNSLVFDNGTSIGVNTATPSASYLLDINGKARIQNNSGLSLLVGNTSPVGTATPAVLSLGATFGTTAGSSANVKLRVYDDGGSSTIYGIGISATLLEIQSNENIGFFNGNSVTRTERMRIFTNGNVAIGTTTDAGYKLDVNGTARVSGTELRLDNGTTGTLNIYSATPTINFFSGGGYTFGRSSTTMTWNSGGSISMQIGGNSAYSLDATNGHVWRTATSGGAALARLTTGGNLMVGTTTDVASAILQVTSTTKGFLPPRMTNAQMVAIATPAAGLVVYDTTNNKLNVYDGTNWVAVH